MEIATTNPFTRSTHRLIETSTVVTMYSNSSLFVALTIEVVNTIRGYLSDYAHGALVIGHGFASIIALRRQESFSIALLLCGAWCSPPPVLLGPIISQLVKLVKVCVTNSFPRDILPTEAARVKI